MSQEMLIDQFHQTEYFHLTTIILGMVLGGGLGITWYFLRQYIQKLQEREKQEWTRWIE